LFYFNFSNVRVFLLRFFFPFFFSVYVLKCAVCAAVY